ncbi:hypothetical protein [Flavobacterium glycines]|uniref:hypothetical protein n=1 Tax=Flavobacterium glycines TaxID=551990 RepID=UPI0011123672|nr:hypothetical protein [Flavobacterium glycines]
MTNPISVTVASSPRTFYIRAEAGTTNCYSTASFTVTVTDNPDITVQNLTACETGTTGAASVNLNNAILTNPDGGVISFYNSLADAQNEVNAVTSPISVTVASSPRTFYIRAEAGTTNCYSTASFTVIVTDNPDVTTTPLSSCESGSTGQATFTLNSGVTDADGGTLSFYTDVAMTNLISDENAGLTGVQYTTGSRTIYVKSVSGSCMGTAQFVITVNANPTCDITGEQTVCLGGSSTFTATAGMTTYAWTGPNNFSANTPSISVSVAGVYYVTITNANGCQSTCSRELMVVTCGGPICTYTQGAYGNSGGKYCDGTEGGIPTVDLITQALTNAGGTITVGKLGSSVVMSLGDENCIITQMPGGGKATEIVPAGDYDICPSLPNSFLKNGKINNVLLSQTIALSLNVNITNPSKLGNFELQAGTLATAKPEGGCGSEVAKPRVCGHFEGNIWVGTVNEYTYRTFSAAVINAIIPDGNGMKTIAGLLDLANRALANVDDVKNSEDGASLSDIAGAVAAVNEVFDECAIAVGWDIEKCPEPPTLDLATVTTAKISSVETAGFDAYPVPFKDQLTIKYNFDYVSDVTIEVFNSKGIIVYSMIDTNSYLGKEVVITINATLEQQQVYYVRLTTSQGSTVKSVMSSY